MNRFAASILALGLAAAVAATGTASAQTSSVSPTYRDGDRPVAGDAAYYDYAKVIRVDPVLQPSYRTTPSSSQRCWTEDGYYTQDDRSDDRYNDGRYDDRYGRDDGYGRDRYADDRYDDRYSDRRYGTETGRNVATVIGGIVGAALGSKVGGGSARYATAAVGSMVGSMAGREVYESAQRTKERQRNTRVTVCDPVSENDNRTYPMENTVSGYDVTYEYAGRQHMTRTNYHPGDRIRVRVDVQAE